MEHTFETTSPPTLFVEVGSGNVEIVSGEISGQTMVTVSGHGADETTVEQRGDTIVVIGPRRQGWSRGGPSLTVGISGPAGSHLRGQLGTANLVVAGALGDVALTCGSGDITLEDVASLEVVAGSGGLHVNGVTGRGSVRSGSGDLHLHEVSEDLQANTGSGDLVLGSVGGWLNARSGSGDVRVTGRLRTAEISTASGDVTVTKMDAGSLDARTVSGDVAVGVTPGLHVWTDINTISGDITSDLTPLGSPEEGTPFVELRLRTISGDIAIAHHQSAQLLIT